MRFVKPFCGVPDGQIYPVEYKAGDECPPELLDAAKSVGAVDTAKSKGKHVSDA